METVPTYPFRLPTLRFSKSDLEPFCDARTLNDHLRYHAEIIDRLNELLKDEPSLHGLSIEEILRGIEEISESRRESVRHWAGGHANHQFFWKILKPFAEKSEPEGLLLEAINRDFGSFDSFRERFADEATELKGNGWAFLVVDPKASGKLRIFVGAENESVLYRGTPGLLVCDLWAHAYSDTFENITTYLDAFWRVADWDVVARRLTGIREGKKQL